MLSIVAWWQWCFCHPYFYYCWVCQTHLCGFLLSFYYPNYIPRVFRFVQQGRKKLSPKTKIAMALAIFEVKPKVARAIWAVLGLIKDCSGPEPGMFWAWLRNVRSMIEECSERDWGMFWPWTGTEWSRFGDDLSQDWNRTRTCSGPVQDLSGTEGDYRDALLLSACISHTCILSSIVILFLYPW